jgi:hypothetical protein
MGLQARLDPIRLAELPDQANANAAHFNCTIVE